MNFNEVISEREPHVPKFLNSRNFNEILFINYFGGKKIIIKLKFSDKINISFFMHSNIYNIIIYVVCRRALYVVTIYYIANIHIYILIFNFMVYLFTFVEKVLAL